MPAQRSFALLLAASALTVGGCKKPGAGELSKRKEETAAVKLPLVTAELGNTPSQLVLTGIVKADQRTEVTADTQGKVLGVFVDRGQRVKFNDPLVRLDVRTASLSAQEAKANLESARAQRQLADSECKRVEQLLAQGAITKSEYDRQMSQCSTALQQVTAAEARTQMYTKGVADGIVRAPFEGVIDTKSVSPGEWVTPGRSLFVLVDDNPLKIELSVPEAAIGALAVDQPLTIKAVAYPKQVFHATITRVGAEIGRTRALLVEATISDGAGKLVPGMFAEATVTVGSEPKPTLPTTAISDRGGKLKHAYVIVDGVVQDRIVQLGVEPSPGMVSVLQGVNAGDKVVANATEQVVDGLHVSN